MDLRIAREKIEKVVDAGAAIAMHRDDEALGQLFDVYLEALPGDLLLMGEGEVVAMCRSDSAVDVAKVERFLAAGPDLPPFSTAVTALTWGMCPGSVSYLLASMKLAGHRIPENFLINDEECVKPRKLVIIDAQNITLTEDMVEPLLRRVAKHGVVAQGELFKHDQVIVNHTPEIKEGLSDQRQSLTRTRFEGYLWGPEDDRREEEAAEQERNAARWILGFMAAFSALVMLARWALGS